jgi:hypothetical protein
VESIRGGVGTDGKSSCDLGSTRRDNPRSGAFPGVAMLPHHNTYQHENFLSSGIEALEPQIVQRYLKRLKGANDSWDRHEVEEMQTCLAREDTRLGKYALLVGEAFTPPLPLRDHGNIKPSPSKSIQMLATFGRFSVCHKRNKDNYL